MASESYLLKCDIRSRNRIFRQAIRQVILLNEQIVQAKTRYKRACDVNRRSYRYTTRLRLAAVEGTRNVYYEYASIKCNEIEDLQEQLRELTGEEYDFADENNNFTDEEEEEEEAEHSGYQEREDDESGDEADEEDDVGEEGEEKEDEEQMEAEGLAC